MSIKCMHCGGRHARLDTVRQCAADAGVKPVLPKREMWLPTLGPIAPVRHKLGMPPPGYYWLKGHIVAKIRLPAEGRWQGRYFISACSRMENSEKAVFQKPDREEFLTWLFNQPWPRFMVRYGTITGYCPACGGKLRHYELGVGIHDSSGPYGFACDSLVHGRYTLLTGG